MDGRSTDGSLLLFRPDRQCSWLEAAENLAYPVSLQRALGQAFGYADPESFKEDVEKFSLLRQGAFSRQKSPLIFNMLSANRQTSSFSSSMLQASSIRMQRA